MAERGEGYFTRRRARAAMSDHIPAEIVTNILNRVTNVKDLVRWRRVSKEWLSIIDSDEFIKRHLKHAQATNSNRALFIGTGGAGVFFRSEDDISGSVNLLARDENSTLDRLYYASTLMGSCHGLVCFWIGPPTPLVVLNPSTGEERLVMTTISTDDADPYGSMIGYGFGYDPLSDDYKAVSIFQCPKRVKFRLEIHCVRARCCTSIPTSWIFQPDPYTYSMGVFACGALHWPHFSKLIALDLQTDTFSHLALPDYDDDELLGYPPSVAELDSCLCACFVYPNLNEVDIWVMKDYGEEGSWSRIYNIQLIPESLSSALFTPVGRSRSNNGDDEVLFVTSGFQFFRYNPVSNTLEADYQLNTEIGYQDIRDTQFDHKTAVYCMESLVKVLPPTPAATSQKQLKRSVSGFSSSSSSSGVLDSY